MTCYAATIVMLAMTGAHGMHADSDAIDLAWHGVSVGTRAAVQHHTTRRRGGGGVETVRMCGGESGNRHLYLKPMPPSSSLGARRPTLGGRLSSGTWQRSSACAGACLHKQVGAAPLHGPAGFLYHRIVRLCLATLPASDADPVLHAPRPPGTGTGTGRGAETVVAWFDETPIVWRWHVPTPA